MIKQRNSKNITDFTLDGKSGEFSQLVSEKKTQMLTIFSGIWRPRKHRLMMLNLTAVFAVCSSSDVHALLNVGTIWQATS